MKDAKGHGSEPRGGAAHQAGVEDVTNTRRPADPAKVDSFVSGAQNIINSYYQKNFADAPHMVPPTLEATHGDRYVRIASTRKDASGNYTERSAHAFIDKQTGDVLKPAGWKAPAKGARGNIHDEHNGLGRMGPHGPAYNK